MLVALAFLGASLPLLDDFGSTWDFGQVFYGERYLDALRGRPGALDFEQPMPGQQPGVPDLEHHRTEGPDLVWPLGPMLAALSHRLFHEQLGWLPSMAAYHLASLLGTAALLAFLTAYLWPRLGAPATLLAALFLATHPAFLWHSLANFKDPVAAMLFVMVGWLGVQALASARPAAILAVGALFGLALAAKGNALFLPLAVLLGLPLSRGRGSLRRVLRPRILLSVLVASLIIAPLVLFAVWPWLWTDPVAHLRRHVEAVLHNRSGTGQPLGGVLYAFFGAPEVFLSGFFIGLLVLVVRPAWLRERPAAEQLLRLCLVLVVVPLTQASWPGAKHYDSVRRYLEFVPPAAVLAGAGWASVLQGLAASRPAQALRALLVLCVLGGSLFPLVRSHPDEHLYYNSWIGGAAGAQARHYPSAVDYWGHSHRRLVEWLREHAEPGATVFTPTGPQVARLCNEVFGRDDLRFPGTGPLRAGEVPDGTFYIAFVHKPEYHNLLAHYALGKLAPVFRVENEGVTLARVYAIPAADEERHAEIRQLAEFSRAEHERQIAAARTAAEQRPDKVLLARLANEVALLDGFDRATEEVRRIAALPPWRAASAVVEEVLEYLDRNRSYSR